MSLLNDLQKSKKVFTQCQNCEEEFSLSRASLFNATAVLPPLAARYLADQKQGLAEMRKDLALRKLRAKNRPAIAAEASRLGKVLEKVAPSLPGFPVVASDCRALFEPIDYIVFDGLTKNRKVDSLIFVDVKSGSGRLTKMQQKIKELVTRGKLFLRIAQHGRAIE